jgi:phage/conjugal plasmid C-4 type zinc finger TraR family protein
MNTTSTRIDKSAGGLLQAELEGILRRLQHEGDVLQIAFVGGDFLDVAQGVEQQELARLAASRLTERARRLRIALLRLQDGEYGVCSDCGGPIPPNRLRALPDTTTCVACQEQLERVGPGIAP